MRALAVLAAADAPLRRVLARIVGHLARLRASEPRGDVRRVRAAA